MGTAEDYFEGPPTGLPTPMARGTALYRPDTGPPVPVRHLGGYAPFVEFSAGRGERAEELAADPGRLIRFLRASGAELENDGGLRAAAAIFAGNTIAALRPDGCWTAYESAPPTVGNREAGFEPDRLLAALASADDEAVSGLLSKLSDWAQEEPDPGPAPRPVPVPPPAGASRYLRPPLPASTYHSAAGEALHYGRRWGADGPDPASYGVESHPERFAGLHAVAQALVGYLAAEYDVDIDEKPAHAGELLREASDVRRAVRVTPRSAVAAPLTLVLTGYPGVMVHAGVLHDFPFPACGCDACDETAGSTADRLEQLVLAVAAGGYSERYPVGRRRWSEYALTAVDGSGAESGRGEPGTLDASRLADAELRLRNLTGGWAPWPPRRG
ncbi:DUF6226 family protein [Arthrobacter sp. UYEF3]|uniref:DUF6226 family protein n=1 Tax=Arthrobacter sp. UYEF3 TaxID=1756365 RepID=UPI0033977AF0